MARRRRTGNLRSTPTVAEQAHSTGFAASSTSGPERSSGRGLPLNSPNWLPLNDACRQGKARLGESDFLIDDLQRGLETGRLRSKSRRLVGGKNVEELLNTAVWHVLMLVRELEGLCLQLRTGVGMTREQQEEMRNALQDSPRGKIREILSNRGIVYVWKPDLDER